MMACEAQARYAAIADGAITAFWDRVDKAIADSWTIDAEDQEINLSVLDGIVWKGQSDDE